MAFVLSSVFFFLFQRLTFTSVQEECNKPDQSSSSARTLLNVRRLVYVISLRSVEFGSNFTEYIPRTAKIGPDRSYSQVESNLAFRANFVSKLDSMLR